MKKRFSRFKRLHARHVLVRQVRPDSPVRQRRCHMCPTVKTLNCKSPGGPRSPRAAKLDRRSRRVASRARAIAMGKWMRRRFPLSPRRLKSTTHTGTYRCDKRTGQSRVKEGDGALPPKPRSISGPPADPDRQTAHDNHKRKVRTLRTSTVPTFTTHINRIPTLICGFVNR